MYSDLEQRLIANVIDQWCKTKAEEKKLHYDAANNSSYKQIRFTTPFIENLLPETEHVNKRWGKNYSSVYEFDIGGELVLRCLVCTDGFEPKKNYSKLREGCETLTKSIIILQQWNVSENKTSLYQINDKILDEMLTDNIAYFETELKCWKIDPSHTIKKEKCEELEILKKSELPETIYIEGARKRILLDKYERNPKARQKCLEVHGYRCKICGFDFAEKYGEAGKGIIEVHHIKPISEIGEAYEVDPINDLIPVCSNCHTLLHSRKEKVYSVIEVKNMIKKQ